MNLNHHCGFLAWIDSHCRWHSHAALVAACLALAACGGSGAPGPNQTPAIACSQKPEVPVSLVASSVLSTSAILRWNSNAVANCSVTFNVAVDGSTVANKVAASPFRVTGLSPDHAYSLTVSASDAAGESSPSIPLNITTSHRGTISHGIEVTGRLIWHTYAQYGFSGVRGWMANFDTGTVSEITPSRLDGAMNYHLSPDGQAVVVMANDHEETARTGIQAWDIWIASVGDSGLTNLTKLTHAQTDGSRNEDPKFSSDGTRIIFKRNLHTIVTLDTTQLSINGVDQSPAQTQLLDSAGEVSMPYLIPGSSSVFLYADASTKAIYYKSGTALTPLYAPTGHAYYPIALDATRFYFVAGSTHDSILQGDLQASPAATAAFGTSADEYADPCPLGTDWLALTSTSSGGTGQYDIWIGNFASGEKYNLDAWIDGANHINNDLGPTFRGTLNAPH